MTTKGSFRSFYHNTQIIPKMMKREGVVRVIPPRRPKFKAPPRPSEKPKQRKLRAVKSFVHKRTTKPGDSCSISTTSAIVRSSSATPPPIIRRRPLRSIKSFVHKRKAPVPPPPSRRPDSPSWSTQLLTRTPLSEKPKRRRASSIHRSKGVFIFKWSSNEDKLRYMIRFGVVSSEQEKINLRVNPGKFRDFRDFHVDLGIELATRAESTSSDLSIPFRSHLSLKRATRRVEQQKQQQRTKIRRPTARLEREVEVRLPGRNFQPIMIDFPFRRLGIQFHDGTITALSRSALALGVHVGDSIWKINNMDIHKDVMITPEMSKMDIDTRICYITSKCSFRPLRVHFWRPKRTRLNSSSSTKNLRRCTSMQLCAHALQDMRLKSLENVKSTPPNLWHAQPCKHCCQPHNRYSRSCIDCGDPFCRECKKVYMNKLGKKKWVCKRCTDMEKKLRKRLDGISGRDGAKRQSNKQLSNESVKRLPPQLPQRKKKPRRLHALKKSQQQYSHSSTDLQKELFAVLQKRKKSDE